MTYIYSRLQLSSLVKMLAAMVLLAIQLNVDAAPVPPVASFTYTWPGLTVQFTDTSEDPDGTIVAWNWDFGDSIFSTEQHPLHTYAEAGTYIVRLIVIDNESDSAEVVDFVVVQPGPGGSFGDFTEVTPSDTVFLTPQDEDFWTVATAPADFDNDGDLDIAVMGYYVVYNVSADDRLMLMRNEGATGDTWNFSYITLEADSLYAGATDLAWADADGDGDLDLAIGSDGQTAIFRNNAGVLDIMPTTLPGYWEDNSQAYYDLRSITWADYDNDGDNDLLLPSVFNEDIFEYETHLMRNDSTDAQGNVIFSPSGIILTGAAHAQTTWADADNDQDLDLLVVNMDPMMDAGHIIQYTNNGDSSFTPDYILGSLTVEHDEAQWGDYDSDGDLDVLVGGNLKETDGSYTPVALRIYRNTGAGYDTVQIIPCTTCDWFDVYAASWADYDSDGDMDILVAGSYNSGSEIEGRARILINENGVFTPFGPDLPAPHASGDRGGTFSWLDMDNDGDLDYFIAGEYFVPGGNGLVESQMHLYRNDSQLPNLAPTLPSGVQSTPQGEEGVMITWNPSSDDHTPMAAITYDLELYRDSVPVSIPARLPQPGNVSAVNEWLLENLPDGHYEYTIRAVDNSFTGSVAATGQFSIGTTIPVRDIEASQKLQASVFPNPATEHATIRFTLPSTANVDITLYDASGNRISTLTNNLFSQGTHEIVISHASLASGLYFYRVTARNKTATGKFVINR